MKAPFPATRRLRQKLLCTMVQVVQLPVLAVFVPALLKKMMNAWIFEAWRNDHPTPSDRWIQWIEEQPSGSRDPADLAANEAESKAEIYGPLEGTGMDEDR